MRVLDRTFSTVDGCMLWEGAIGGHGYGNVWNTETKKYSRAHHLAYEQEIGPIPDGLDLDHLCEQPICVNPLHLEPVTDKENKRRAVERRTHCKRGHEYTEFNTFMHPGYRECIECRKLRARERYHAKL